MSENTILAIAVIAVVVSFVGMMFAFTTPFSSIQLAPTNMTQGNVTVTILQNLAIVFTNSTIDFGSGSVQPSLGWANLSSRGEFFQWQNLTPANVTDGFVLENVGNVNVSLYIKTDRNASGFIMSPSNGTASGGATEAFNFMVNNCNTVPVTGNLNCRPAINESEYDNAAACAVGQSGFNFGNWYPVNSSSPGGLAGALGTIVCRQFNWEGDKDELRIDVNIVIPQNAPQTAKRSTMTATAEAPL